MSDFGLRAYQEEVVQRALQGENTIIWLPTGGGKTRAAVYVSKRHLETTRKAKVVVLVNKVHLVEQHYKNEFQPHLGGEYKVVLVSGECDEKDFFGKVVKDSDLVICTAQILENALNNKEDGKHVELSEITLLIIDECHHTHKEGVYNKIMRQYIEKKLKKEGPLPQILGLTASPGTGGGKSLQKAVDHVLQICANLDSAIVSSKIYAPELKKKVPRPIKRFDIVDPRPKDPFGDHLKWMMRQIHEILTLPPDFTLREIGTQEYEADVVILEKKGVHDSSRLLAQCALHLRQYNDALLINDTLRMSDAYHSLEAFYSTKDATAIDGTDFFLLGLFQENQTELRMLARDACFENPKMDQLQRTLLQQFGPLEKSRGIIFCKTRTSTICLNDWVHKNPALREAGIKAAILTGAEITLLIIDECHHTHKEGVYNKIMRQYIEKKLKKEGPLPQILGLTASPGTGGGKSLQKAVDHVLQICANLDSAIVSSKIYAPELKKKVPRPIKRFDIVDPRPKDPFGDHLKWMMRQIHEILTLPPDFTLREIGTQEYEADVVILEKKGVHDSSRLLAQCALHLRQYNDALLINDTLRMSDAYHSLEAFYSTKDATAIDGTDFFLLGLFQENQTELRMLARDACFENPKMDQLQRTLLQQFGPLEKSRGIIFCKTRTSTICLNDWVHKNPALREAGIKAAILTGAGNGISYMTQNEQRDTIRNFRDGALNLLISTSVAEEGLDIPECNLVVRYGLLTNEIAQQQASGRARAPDSVYSVVAQAGGREVRREHTNEFLEELTGKAIGVVQSMDPREFRSKITELHVEAVISSRLAETQKGKKKSRYSAANIQLLCRNCFVPVAYGNDIRLVENVHYVNINPNFEKYYKAGGKVFIDRSFEDWEPGRVISCNNGNCNKEWGFEMKYKKAAILPNMSIKNFALETPEGRITAKKWKDVPFTVDEFILSDYAKDKFPAGLFDDSV